MHLFNRVPFAALTLLVSWVVLSAGINRTAGKNKALAAPVEAGANRTASLIEKYGSWQLEKEGISRELFINAMKGYQYLEEHQRLVKTDIITIADFSKPSSEKRLFVLDIESGKILFKTLVAHGKNSGREIARSFSNAASSFASSLGFYVTADTYMGKHGYSLRLTGCERGFNDNAYKRAVVVHGAAYVSESFIRQNGYLGRSHGCPAIPAQISKDIIDTIKGGSCLFIYSPVEKYLTQSALLKS